MFSISESYFAELHMLSNQELKDLQGSYVKNFPYRMAINVPFGDEEQMLADAVELAGEEHPETSTEYCDDYSWSCYHPTVTNTYEDHQVLTCFIIGFKNQRDALQFKLRWFKS